MLSLVRDVGTTEIPSDARRRIFLGSVKLWQGTKAVKNCQWWVEVSLGGGQAQGLPLQDSFEGMGRRGDGDQRAGTRPAPTGQFRRAWGGVVMATGGQAQGLPLQDSFGGNREAW